MAHVLLHSVEARDITGARAQLKGLSAQRVRQTLWRILKKTPLCAIATVGKNGRAHINTAYFGYSDDLELYFLSHPHSLHCRNLQARPTMAIAVFESAQRWGELDRGLQLFGTCRESRGRHARRAEMMYARRFKPYGDWRAELDADDVAREYRFYCFMASRLKLFDEREFGGAIFVTAAVRRRR
jgi:uncharacterized protein YhbP (UPF0306 family)